MVVGVVASGGGMKTRKGDISSYIFNMLCQCKQLVQDSTLIGQMQFIQGGMAGMKDGGRVGGSELGEGGGVHSEQKTSHFIACSLQLVCSTL